MPPCGYGGPAIAVAHRFVGANLADLRTEVLQGRYPDLRAGVQAEVGRLRASREWVAEQLKTTEGFAALCANGFTEALLLDAFNGVMLNYYERLLYQSDPEADTSQDIYETHVLLYHRLGQQLAIMHLRDDGSMVRKSEI